MTGDSEISATIIVGDRNLPQPPWLGEDYDRDRVWRWFGVDLAAVTDTESRDRLIHFSHANDAQVEEMGGRHE